MRGFTLIELLVVITIIVVLLALLTPALDKAIYQAELAVCGTNQKAIANSVTIYAMGFKRRYPYRAGIDQFGAQAYALANGRDGWDDRPLLMEYMPLDMFNDPLTGDLEFDPLQTDPKSLVFSSVDLWFGFRYRPAEQAPGAGMFKVGDRFSWMGDRFNYLSSDRDVVRYDNSFSHNSHPDAAGVLTNNVRQDEFQQGNILDETFGDPYTKARWESHDVNPPRGQVDLNFGSADGSVVRVNQAEIRDDRLLPVPEYAQANNFTSWASYLAIP